MGTWNLKESDKFDDYMKELGKEDFSVFVRCTFIECEACAHACETGERMRRCQGCTCTHAAKKKRLRKDLRLGFKRSERRLVDG